MLGWIYVKLRYKTLFSGMIGKIERQINIIYPSSREMVIKKTMTLFLKICFIDAVLMGVLIYMGLPMYYLIISILTIYIISSGYLNMSFQKAYSILLEKQEKFISDLRYRYQLAPIIEDSLQETIYNSDEDISLHGQLLLDHLLDESYGSESEYREIAANGYFLTLYALCNTVRNYGDKRGSKGSVFVENLGYLKEEIHIEMQKRRKEKSVFSGLLVMSVLPVFAMRPIEIWSVYNMPEIVEHFNSPLGRLITILMGLLSIVTYYVVSRLKYSEKVGVEVKDRWVILANKGLIEKLILKYMSVNYKKSVRLNNRLREIGYIYNVKEYLFRKIVFSVVVFMGALITCISAGLPFWWSVFALPVTYYGMSFALFLREEMIKLEREEEVMRFQNIILMLMESENINIQMILEQMEVFAVTFKSKIEYLLDEYPYRGFKIFEEIKEESGFKPFDRLMESFIACDSMSIDRAFDDVKSDRQYYVEKHKMDNEIIIDNKGAVAKLIALLPLYAIIIFKLILPFVLEGMTMMSESGL